MKVIIGLAGFARSGKDTAAEYLVRHYGFRRYALADAVREALYALDPLVRLNTYGSELADGRQLVGTQQLRYLVDTVGWEEAKRHQMVRELLQRMGTEAGRELLGEDCWLRLLAQRIHPSERVVVSDIRFENEARFVHRADADRALVVALRRPGCGPANAHLSERGIASQEIDFYLDNDASKEALARRLDRLMLISGVTRRDG